MMILFSKRMSKVKLTLLKSMKECNQLS